MVVDSEIRKIRYARNAFRIFVTKYVTLNTEEIGE
jgi:hypothetical protein